MKKKYINQMVNLIALILIGLSYTSLAESIYSYDQGRKAAERLQRSTPLSEDQIQSAIAGFSDQLRGENSIYTSAQFSSATEQHYIAIAEANEAISQNNLIAGEAYFKSLQTDPQVTFANLGWAYKVLTQGTGPIPTDINEVQLTYVGKHLNGTEFDRGDEAVWISMTGIFPGWKEALLQMTVDSHWQIIIPPHLAYGEVGAGEKIGPNETIVFDLKLLGVR